MSKKLKSSFKSFLGNLPDLKKVDPLCRDRLPYVFDLHWDIKYHDQLLSHCQYRIPDAVKRYLAEYGYDVNDFEKQLKNMTNSEFEQYNAN